MPTLTELKQLQALPLEVKILKSKLRIREWVNYWGKDSVYISFSGGKDSTVLLNLVREEFPDIEGVFSDTGLEFPEIKAFVKTFSNIKTVKPNRTFLDVIKNEGYPVVSKKVARQIRDLQNPSAKNAISRNLYLTGEKIDGTISKYYKLSKKWLKLQNAPFKVSEKCCNIIKKEPIYIYGKETNKKAIIGTMAEESQQREMRYLKTGCNSFEGTEKSQPISFWTEQDILKYIKQNNLKIASVYGEIIEEDEKLKTTGEKRTGCMFCAFGAHLEKGENRFQRMKRTHPQIYDYCIREENGLGLGKVLDYVGIKY